MTNKLYTENYNGVDLRPVSSLNKLMSKLLEGFDVAGVHGEMDYDFNPYSIFHIDGDFNLNKDSYRNLYYKYPVIELLHVDLKNTYKMLRTPKKYIEADVKYSIADLSAKIKKHNSTLKFPKEGEFLLEKAASFEWRAYNTPNAKNISITPLHGTDLPFIDLKDKSPLNIYTQWKISSYMLIWEYNILNRAKRYMDNMDSNSSQPLAYKDAFVFWQNRQISIYMENPNLFRVTNYIADFSDLDLLYKEICEDFLYVMLNILLAKFIVEQINIKDYIDCPGSDFDSKMKFIINLHYQKYDEYYKSLDSIRIAFIQKSLTESDLKEYLR